MANLISMYRQWSRF
ncbi:hypothetical protein F383_36053 [Gossypium arboreum]|nr:hypothetical protein F383_37613 [Gossypium arboreum]KHG07133.1 hypothetical protein F383_32998 [Gossypium arboreum]KHG09011.1 hypothetical protein F383_36053 [Gossypium arboreum]